MRRAAFAAMRIVCILASPAVAWAVLIDKGAPVDWAEALLTVLSTVMMFALLWLQFRHDKHR